MNADLCKIIHLQRQQRCLFELFQIFLIPETQKLYKPLWYFRQAESSNIQSMAPLRTEPLKTQKEEQRLSVALGQVVNLCMHLGNCLGVPAKNPMIYNGHRSLIINSKQE